MRKLLKLLFLTALTVTPTLAQVSGAGQLSCNGATIQGTLINSSTANNTTIDTIAITPAVAVLVQLTQTTPITTGAVTFQTSFDASAAFSASPVAQVLNPSTGAQLTNPYTLQASTTKQFLIVLAGASTFRLRLTTAITGAGTVTPYYTALCTPPTIGPLTLDSVGNLLINLNTHNITSANPIPVALIPQTSQGWSPFLANGLTTTVITVKGGAGELGGYYCYNPNSTAAYLQIFDISGTVTLGTSTPKWSIGLPQTGGANIEFTMGVNFANAIKVAVTTTATGSTATTSAVDCNFLTK